MFFQIQITESMNGLLCPWLQTQKLTISKLKLGTRKKNKEKKRKKENKELLITGLVHAFLT